MFANAAWSWGRPIVAEAACSWILTELSRSISDVDWMRLLVVVLRAVIWSRTIFWFPSVCATITAVRLAETVVVAARSTPWMSAMLFLMVISMAMEFWMDTASWVS